MNIIDSIIDFILKYLVCPWSEIGAYSIAVMLSSVGMLILVIIMISLNKLNDFKDECKKLRTFIYVVCIFIIPCFGILFPIYIFIPIIPLLMREIYLKEKEQIKILYTQYKVESDFITVYKSVKANPMVQIIITVLSCIIILSIMHFIGFDYHFKPVLPNI